VRERRWDEEMDSVMRNNDHAFGLFKCELDLGSHVLELEMKVGERDIAMEHPNDMYNGILRRSHFPILNAHINFPIVAFNSVPEAVRDGE